MATRSLILSTLILALNTFPRGAQCAGRCTGFDDYAGSLIFVANDKFCSEQLGYVECDFHCNRQPVVVNGSDFSIPPLVLESASLLHIPPICVSWITVRRSARVSTTRGSGENQHCGYWLRLEDSQAIGLDYGIVDLSMKDSSVEYINSHRLRQLNIYNSSITSIDHVEIVMYPSTIVKSWIKDIFFINITVTDLKISDTVIDTIGPGSIIFNGLNLIFENVSIRNLKTRGINMLSGKLIMKNCSIENVAENAIVADDSKIVLSDVAIKRVQKPGFDFGSGAEISFTNVFVRGHEIESVSNYVQYPDIVDTADVAEEVVITGFSNEHCEFHLGILQCDFSGVNKPVVFERNSLPLQLTINIMNARMLHAVGDFSCAHINIINCTGKFISYVNATCPSIGKLSVTSSNLTSISSKMASHITIKSSSVAKLHATSVKFLEVAHSTFLSLYDVTVDREATWSGSYFLQVSSVQLKGLGRIQDCKFGRLLSLVLNPKESSISFSSSTINSMPQRRGVWVKSGILALKNVTVLHAIPASLYLEEEAIMALNNVTYGVVVFGAISVSRLEQVSFISEEGSDYVSLMQKRSSEESRAALATPTGAYIADVAKSFCRLDDKRLLCDYSDVKQAVVVVSSEAAHVILRSASSVILRPTKSQSVAMTGVTSLSVDQQQSEAELDLTVINSTFVNLTTVVYSLMLENTSMNSFFLPPDHTMMSFTTRNCDMSELVLQAQLAHFFLSKIDKVRLLTSDSMLIKDSFVGKIFPAGMVVRSDGYIDSTTIDFLDKNSIVIHGVFTVVNVNISNAANNSIVVRESGSVIIKSVTIHNCTKCPFLILGNVESVSELRINGVHINSTKIFHQYCGGDEAMRRAIESSELEGEVTEKGRTFWLGLSLGAMISLFVAATILLVVRTCRSGSRLQLPLVSWRNSTETIIYSGLKQDEPPQQEQRDAPPEPVSENSRLVEKDDEK